MTEVGGVFVCVHNERAEGIGEHVCVCAIGQTAYACVFIHGNTSVRSKSRFIEKCLYNGC